MPQLGEQPKTKETAEEKLKSRRKTKRMLLIWVLQQTTEEISLITYLGEACLYKYFSTDVTAMHNIDKSYITIC